MSDCSRTGFDNVHHVAVEVDDIATSLAWYTERFNCRVEHCDDTWAMIEFGNLGIALVTKGSHPPQIGFATNHAKQHGELVTHRDGVRSTYVTDPAGNAVELIDPASVAMND